ncbi:MAG: DUF2911 domain-containing protein, partial [Bacteroidota bacterium]
AGKYALFTKPYADQWEIYFYTTTNHFDVPNPVDSSKLIYLTEVEVIPLAVREETLVINFYNLTETSAELGISWEQTAVRIPIQFYTKEAMEKMIAKEFRQNIIDYSIAVSYYAQRGIELEKAKEILELVMELREEQNAWDFYQYGLILHQQGKESEAITYLNKSLQMARQFNDVFTIGEVEKLLKSIGK